MASLRAFLNSTSSTVRSPSRLTLGVLGCCAALVSAGAADGLPVPLHLSVTVRSKDVNPNGSFEIREQVYSGGNQVGEGSTRCSRSIEGRRRCSGAFTLVQGEIDFAGTTGSERTTRFAISGGEGRYRHSRGTVVSAFSPGGSRATETISFY